MSARSQQQPRLSPPSPTLSKRSSKLPKADPSDFHEIPSMNDLTNGLAKAGAANGGVARRRRTKKKTLSNGSPHTGNGIITPSDSSSNSDPDDDSRSNFTSDSDSTTFEEWTGIMKRVVDEWEIPRKVLHSSIGASRLSSTTLELSWWYQLSLRGARCVSRPRTGSCSCWAPASEDNSHRSKLQHRCTKPLSVISRPRNLTAHSPILFH